MVQDILLMGAYLVGGSLLLVSAGVALLAVLSYGYYISAKQDEQEDPGDPKQKQDGSV